MVPAAVGLMIAPDHILLWRHGSTLAAGIEPAGRRLMVVWIGGLLRGWGVPSFGSPKGGAKHQKSEAQRQQNDQDLSEHRR